MTVTSLTVTLTFQPISIATANAFALFNVS